MSAVAPLAPTQSVRLLLVEDSQDDALLILRALEHGGFETTWRRVDTSAGLREALDEPWDAVIADYSMPGFSGLEALAQVKAIRPDMPFILASAVIGEERAVEAIRAGAHDFVMKRNLARLPLVLARELRESEQRREKQRTEVALRRQTQFTAALASSLGDAVYALDADARLTFANAAAERIVGWRSEELLGREIHATVHPEHPAGQACPVTEVIRSGQSFHADEDVFRHKDGSLLPVSFTASPLRGDQKVVGVVLVLQDISQRKRAAEAARFLARASAALAESLEYDETIARIASVCVPELADFCTVRVPEDGGALAHASASTAETPVEVRRAAPDAEWPPCEHVIRSGTPAVAREAAPELFSSDNWTAEERGVLEGLHPTQYACVAMRADNETVGALFLASTHLRAPIDAAFVDLAQRFADRAAMAITHARLYREAQQAVRVRDDFLSTASHELKTPLTTLKLYIQRLQRNARKRKLGELTTEQLAAIDVSLRQVDRLSRQLDNLLDVSRIVGGCITLEPEELDLAALVREVAERAEPELVRANCRLELRAEVPVLGSWDCLRLDHIVSNLLSNAMKYGAGKPIEISVAEVGATARLVVRDHGIGIAPDQIERIFGRFERAVSTRSYGGMGLGLYIVRQFVEAHGGMVEVESKEGRGSAFTVTLPIHRED